MSRSYCSPCQTQPMYAPVAMGRQVCGGPVAFAGGGYNFTTLVALILIVLVFGSKYYGKGPGCRDGYTGGLDKSILFIIAFFFLACGCGGRGFGGC